MKLERLFHVLVVAGASSTAGLVGCGGDGGGGGGGGASGAASGGASSATGGAGGAASNTCDAKCHPNSTSATWTDCGGCCCWLGAGQTSPVGPICGDEPCCAGKGR